LQRILLRDLATGGGLPDGSVLWTIGSNQMDALQPHYSSRGDLLFERSLVPRRAAVESLPATTVTKETAAAWQQNICPICLDVSMNILN
jgi:hypothetical protein